MLKEVLAQDPRPQYKEESDKVYGMEFGRYDVQDPSAKVKVVVTDGAGRRFSESKIYECDSWENADYSEAVAPEYEETQIY